MKTLITKGYYIPLTLLLILAQQSAYAQTCNCPPINSCAPCQNDFVSFTLRYNGPTGFPLVAADGNEIIYFDLVLTTGEIFTVEGSQGNRKFNNSILSVYINNALNFTTGTSCASGININSTLGSFTVLAAESRNGGDLCCSGDTETTLPVISNCPSDVQVSLTGSGCTRTVTWTAPTATDNCGSVVLTSSHDPGDTFSKGTTQVAYTATDDYGNSATCTFNVVVTDNTAPVITGCPANISVSANASCNATGNWTPPTASDNCTGAVTLSSSHGPGVFPIGTTVVTYTARDVAGNTSTCSFNVLVRDVTRPGIVGCPTDITVSANASCNANVTWTTPTTTDNCAGSVTLTSSHSPGVFPLGTTPVTYLATDAAGNNSTCIFNVIVKDDTKPVITGCPSDITVSANASCTAVVSWTAPTATDNCPGLVTLTRSHSPGSFPKGTTAVTYTATDVAGNKSTCTFNVIVQDVTKPVITGCPSNITVSANATCNATVNWTAPTATDNCAGPVTLNRSHNPGSFPKGTTTVTYTATDVAGNITTCSFNVIVQDVTKPVISGCPSNITVFANATCNATVNWTAPTVTDNCTAVTLVNSHSPGTFPMGTTQVLYTATDGSGNFSTCTFNVIVTDESSPVLSGCVDILAVAGPSCSAKVTWSTPTTTDCNVVTLTSSHSSGDIFPLGITNVTYTATDSNGKYSSCSFKVTVEDKTAPVFENCPTEIVKMVSSSCVETITWTPPAVLDNCESLTVTNSHNPGDPFPLGITTVKYTATDAKGNKSFCQFDVHIKNETLPIISDCPNDIEVKGDENGKAIVDWSIPTATALCGEVTMVSSHQPGNTFQVGRTEVEYKATDNSGNTAYCRFNVIIIQEQIEIDISKVVTPDGNGINDEWQVLNIEKFKDNKVVIVDRWGSVIYTASGYDNVKVIWNGINRNGASVPTGTYFYTITVRYGPALFEKSGFIELIR